MLFHGTVILASFLSGYYVLVFIISFSPFIANWGAYALGMTQHRGLKENDNDFRKATRSVKLNPLAEFLYWHLNWHSEHHMFAGVPCYNLEKLYNEIADQMPEPRTLAGAWKEMRDTWARQQENPDYYFDPWFRLLQQLKRRCRVMMRWKVQLETWRLKGCSSQ